MSRRFKVLPEPPKDRISLEFDDRGDFVYLRMNGKVFLEFHDDGWVSVSLGALEGVNDFSFEVWSPDDTDTIFEWGKD